MSGAADCLTNQHGDSARKEAVIEFVAGLIRVYFYLEANPDVLMDGAGD